MIGRDTLVRIGTTLLVIAAVALALAIAWSGSDPGAGGDPVSVERASGAVSMSNSRSGQSVLSAEGLVPGQTVSGSVVIGNTGDIPMKLLLNGDVTAPGALADALRLRVTRNGSGSLYEGSFTGLDSAMGVLQPDERRRYVFDVTLPSGAGDELQGSATSIDLAWHGKGSAPPPACRIRALRSRFFVFKRRHRIRMVVRYRANAAARVSLVFFERLPHDRKGSQVGSFSTRVEPAADEWRINRLARRRSEAALERLRGSRRGFIVQVRVEDAPSYCARRMNLILTQLRRVDRQFVWFQRGSFRRIR
ncbi:MAG: hypothetical protein J0H98_05725 [Solirubrobacterales bacterium]|nr:hypothetical protein [Solirubrobacterales bacterium]